MAVTPDPTNPAARRPLQPGEAELGAKQLEAVNFAKQQAPNDPNGQQIIASQYLYKKYGILPNNGQGDWQHSGSGGPLGWELKNGDLVPKDRSWWDKYGMTMVAAGILSAGTLDAVMGPAAGAASSAGMFEAPAAGVAPVTSGLGTAALPGAGTALTGPGAAAVTAPAAGASAFDAAGNFVGPSTVSSVGGPTGAGGMSIPWGDVIKGGTQLFGNLFAGQQQIAGADRAAQLMADASKYSADQVAKASADSLAFQGKSAENAFQNNEAARSGNYGVFAARERRLGSIGEEVGLGPREIPAYVPGVDPMFGGGGGSSSAPTNTSSDADIAAAVNKNYQALGFQPTGPGSGPTDAAYMAQKIKETGGLTPGNTSYWFGPGGRIADEIQKAGLARH